METGANEVAVMKSVPVHYWPPLRSVAENPDFLDQPLLKTPAGRRSLEVLTEAVNSGQLPLSESGVPVLKLGPVLQKRSSLRRSSKSWSTAPIRKRPLRQRLRV